MYKRQVGGFLSSFFKYFFFVAFLGFSFFFFGDLLRMFFFLVIRVHRDSHLPYSVAASDVIKGQSWHGADMADPNSEAPAATRPSPTEIPPSVVTEVGCQSPYRRRRRSATARGRFLEMQKWAEVAEKSGSREWARSMPSDAFQVRTGAHVRLAPGRILHLETTYQRQDPEPSPAGVRKAPQPTQSFQFHFP